MQAIHRHGLVDVLLTAPGVELEGVDGLEPKRRPGRLPDLVERSARGELLGEEPLEAAGYVQEVGSCGDNVVLLAGENVEWPRAGWRFWASTIRATLSRRGICRRRL